MPASPKLSSCANTAIRWGGMRRRRTKWSTMAAISRV